MKKLIAMMILAIMMVSCNNSPNLGGITFDMSPQKVREVMREQGYYITKDIEDSYGYDITAEGAINAFDYTWDKIKCEFDINGSLQDIHLFSSSKPSATAKNKFDSELNKLCGASSSNASIYYIETNYGTQLNNNGYIGKTSCPTEYGLGSYILSIYLPDNK